MGDLQDILKQLLSIPGIGNSKEKTAYIFLRFSAIALTAASGYTTFQGFTQYTPFFIAILLTVGIQGLLFASAWKIGIGIKSKKLKFLHVFIFSLTMIASVFFSYSSLLEVIYKKNLRLSDELIEKQNQVVDVISAVKDSISNKVNVNKTYNDFKSKFIIWNDTSSKEVSKYFADLTTTLDRTTSRQKALEYSLLKSKQEYLNNPDSLNRLFYSVSKSSELKNRENRLFPTLTKYQRCKILQIEHDSIFKAITSNNRLITIANISDFEQKKKELFPLILGYKYSEKITELPDSLKKELISISELNIFYNFVDNFKVETYTNIRDLKFNGLKLIDKLPNSFKIDFSKIKRKFLELDKYTGPEQHQFIASIMLLKQGHILVVGALTIAFLIDFLVLFCGVLGALPSCYLTLKTFDDIESVMESSIENIFSIADRDYDTAFKNKLYLIIKNSEPAAIEIAYQGYPAFIRTETIESLNLAAEIGILVSSSQVRTFKDSNHVYLKTRFILWAADKLNT